MESVLELAKTERVEWSRGREQMALMSAMQTKFEKDAKQLRNKLRAGEAELQQTLREK